MEHNFTHIYDSSSTFMDDDIFQAAEQFIQGMDYSATHNFPGFEREDLVITDHLWNGEYVTHEQYQAMEIPQISSSHLRFDDPLLGQSTLKGISAFSKYKKGSSVGVQLCSASATSQKSIKRCFDFLCRMHKSSRGGSNWEVDDGVVEEAYAFTHKISERNRRMKLSQQFLALRSLLPHNPKKVDKISTLSNAIMELNQKRLRIGELEKQNQTLRDAISRNISETYSSLSHGYTADSRRNALMRCVCEEVVVVIEESSNPEEAIIKVRLKKVAPSSTHVDAIVTVVKCLREIKLEVEVVSIESRELDSTNQVIEVTIRTKAKGKRWEINERKEFEEMVKHAFSATYAIVK